MSTLRAVIRRNRAGEAVALASVCSAHPEVLTAALLAAKARGCAILVEATSNQVNQFGGYTGMRPADFIARTRALADALGLDRAQLLFGGDHLGPQAWRHLAAEQAMAHAEAMVAEYVAAGFAKIHLDCSEGCAGEPAQLPDTVTAARAAALAARCEAVATAPLDYIIGTEVPPPGGARAGHGGVTPTTADAARTTLARHREAFAPDIFARVAGLVVQPGLEFGPVAVEAFDTAAPNHLSAALADHPGIAFEAHSTDYQAADVFRSLAARNFAILKVGPALTFALRQALYALDGIARWLRPGAVDLVGTMEALMLAAPAQWQGHYSGTADELRLLRHFSYADRIRYLWADARAQTEVARLHAALAETTPPAPLLRQFVGEATLALAETLPGAWPRRIVLAEIQRALAPYLAVAP